jgi:hypothetical protein
MQASDGDGSLHLERQLLEGRLMAAYAQKNVKASRKQVQPVVDAWMQSRS